MAETAAAPTMAVPIKFDNPVDSTSLKDRSVLITGAASGIGLACAIQMAKVGAFVTILDIQETAGIAVARDLVAQGHRVQFVQYDVTSYVA
jgi:5'-hydroxyaverantin dehydrogenase